MTVVARWTPGLPRDEVHPIGYRILRIEAGPLDGVPLPGRLRRRRQRRDGVKRGARPAGSESSAGPATKARRPLAAPLRALHAAIAPFGRSLTFRGLSRAAAAVSPPADSDHAIGYPRLPVALALGRRDRARRSTTRSTSTSIPGSTPRSGRFGRWFLGRGERRAARAADRVVTVSDAYAGVMQPRFDVTYPLVIWNCSYRFVPPTPPERRFHVLLGLADDRRVVLYHGNFFEERGIEQLVGAIREVQGGRTGADGRWAAREGAASRRGAGRHDGPVRFAPPVPPEELLGWVASADAVAVPVQPATLNHRLTTPQKLFEAMAAGVPVVASDLPGMAPIVRDTGCGGPASTQDLMSAPWRGASHVASEPPDDGDAPRIGSAALQGRPRALQLGDPAGHASLGEYTRLTGEHGERRPRRRPGRCLLAERRSRASRSSRTPPASSTRAPGAWLAPRSGPATR